ncbi:MAG: hypothetical protein EBZ48_04630 [Proteobacteria bacterium]|nr:hypothetical protein [Pseudomonadota bacterium]
MHLRAYNSFDPVASRYSRCSNLRWWSRRILEQFYIVALATTLVVSAGCSGRAPQKPSNGQLQREVSESARAVMDPDLSRASKAIHSFLVGQLAYGSEDFHAATQHLTLAGELASGVVPTINIPLAELNLKAGDLDAALAQVMKARQADPNSVPLRLLEAGILDVRGRETEAQSLYLDLAKGEKPPQDAAYLAAAIYGRQERYEEGAALLVQYLRGDPRNNLLQYLLGLLLENSGNLNRAARQYHEIVRRTPDNVSVQFDRLRVLLRSGQRDRAAAVAEEMLQVRSQGGAVFAPELLRGVKDENIPSTELLKAIRLFAPEQIRMPDLRLKLALVLVQEQQFSAALRELSLIIAGEPRNPVARYYRASLYGGAGRRKEAFEDLFAIQPGQELFIKSRLFAAFLKKQERDFKGAERAVKDALAAEPGDAALFSYLVVLMREGKQYERALALVNDALKKDPNNERLLFSKGTLLSDLGRDHEARAVMEQVLAINDRNPDVLNFIAYDLAERARDLDRAEGLIVRALEISPQDGFYLDTLGWIYFQRRQYEQAVETLRKAQKLSGGDVIVSEHLGDALVKTGAFLEAAEVYRIALEKGRDQDPSERTAEIAEALPRIEQKLDTALKATPPGAAEKGDARGVGR